MNNSITTFMGLTRDAALSAVRLFFEPTVWFYRMLRRERPWLRSGIVFSFASPGRRWALLLSVMPALVGIAIIVYSRNMLSPLIVAVISCAVALASLFVVLTVNSLANREFVDDLLAQRVKTMSRPVFFKHMTNEVNRLRSGDEIRAICGTRDWTHKYVHEYLLAYYKAAQRGVKVTRIFLVDPSAISPEQAHVISDHLKMNNMSVFLADASQPSRPWDLDAGLDVDIFPDKVFMQKQTGQEHKFGGVEITTPMLVFLYRHLFEKTKRDRVSKSTSLPSALLAPSPRND